MSRAKMLRINKHKVQLYLEDLELTQKDLANEVGMNRQALNRALNRGTISEMLLMEIAFALSCDPEYLQDLPVLSEHNPAMKEGAPKSLITEDNIFFYTAPYRYISLERIIKMACAAGFKDKIQELISIL